MILSCVCLVSRKDSHLSALPSMLQFMGGGYITSPELVKVFFVTVSEEDQTYLYKNRDRAYVLGPGLPLSTPDQITDPNMVYYQINDDQVLEKVMVPETAAVEYARIAKLRELQFQFDHAKKGRFPSSALGTLYFYDGADFLLFSLAFVQAGEDGPFANAETETGQFFPRLHTVAQVLAAGQDFRAWYQELQTKYYTKQQLVNGADTVEEINAVTW